MKRPTVHVVGAGVAGLAAAQRLAAGGRCDVVVHEARAYAGGRRRSFHDPAFGGELDTGNFAVLSGWRATQALIGAIGAGDEWRREKRPGVAFVDLAKGSRWRLAPNAGRLPWWLLLTARRGPGLTPADYWPARKLMSADSDRTVAPFAPAFNDALNRLWRPLTLAAFNMQPEAVSARLAGAALREIVLAGGGGLRVLTPKTGIGRALIEPLARSVERAGGQLRFERKLIGLAPDGPRVAMLDFEHDQVELGPRDGVILAASWATAAGLVPGLAPASGATSSMTVHFATPQIRGAPAVLGVLNGPFHWLFNYPNRVSVTIRDAESRIDAPRAELAAECWRAVAALTGVSEPLPAWRVVVLRRAGPLATPEEAARRPRRKTVFANLFLAGGYVSPCSWDSIEGAARSGAAAADAFFARRADSSLSGI